MRIAIALGAVLLATGSAFAFPTGEQFDLDALTDDGAGGIAFDGSPRWSGHTCAVCHTGGPRTVGLRLEADRPELFTDGWKPGQQYHLRVVLTGEHAGVDLAAAGDNCGFSVTPYRACDENGFALELGDANGGSKGTFVPVVAGACANTGTVPPDVDVRVLKDGTAVTHNGAHMALTSWDVCWTAPAAGAGTLTAYVATVDGNGGTGTMEFPTDIAGDDVAAGAVPIAELGKDSFVQSGGCNSAPIDQGLVLVLALLALVVVMRRRRRFAAVLVIAALAGCAHVRPRQREVLAKRKMKFAPDPAEDELDLHMQEAREGSTGGYGSSGGGCGCN